MRAAVRKKKRTRPQVHLRAGQSGPDNHGWQDAVELVAARLSSFTHIQQIDGTAGNLQFSGESHPMDGHFRRGDNAELHPATIRRQHRTAMPSPMTDFLQACG